jgi:RNA polymerase sigma-70 factor, ECF subfamily
VTPQFSTAFRVGQSTWPGISLGLERFAHRLRALGVAEKDLQTHAADLFLASACAEGDSQALQILERRFISEVDAFVARTGLPRHLYDEVRQRIRVKLLVGPAPRIGQYRGQGPLSGWVRVIAVHVAIDVAVANSVPERSDDALTEGLMSCEADPEIQVARSLYSDRLRGAVAESLAALNAREKTILRLHFIDRLSIDAMAAIYRVHRATVARWLVSIRGRVFDSLRQRFALQVGGSPSDMRSLIALLREDLQVSVRRILEDERRR